MEFTLLWAALLGVVVMYAVLYWEAKRGNAAECTKSVWDTVLTAGVAGLVVGRLSAMIIAGTNPITRPGDILIVRGGVDTVWTTIGALVAFAMIARREIGPLADAAAPAVVAGLAGWHAGCLFRDACLGTPSDLPWAYALSGSEVTRHPVELYAALLLVAAAVVLLLLRRSFPATGTIAASALAMVALSRAVTEPMRPVIGSGPGTWYALAALAAATVAFAVAGAGGKDDYSRE